MIIQWNFRIK